MSHGLSRFAGLSLALAVSLAGCKARNEAGNPESGTAGAPPASAADTGSMGRMTGAADTGAKVGATAELTDANIVALLDEANKADSSAGALAAGKATNARVKSFAKLMMSEHHALRLQGEQLAKKISITPEPPANDPLAPAAQDETSALQSTPKGAEFDKVYIDKEVGVHQAVKDLLDKALASAQNQQLKDLIKKAQPVIQKHLDQAQALQKQLTKTA
jgi:putative membrane protein